MNSSSSSLCYHLWREEGLPWVEGACVYHITWHSTQVMEPCSIKALYHLKENVAAADMEETVHVTLSKIIISLSMEAVYALVKLFSRALESVKVCSLNYRQFTYSFKM